MMNPSPYKICKAKSCNRQNEGEDPVTFTDVTIVCEDSTLRAHRVLLSAASPFLHRILADHPGQHPTLVLKVAFLLYFDDTLQFNSID